MSKSINLYETEMQTLLEMTDEERGRIMGALLAERLGEAVSDLTGMEKAVFALILAQVNRADELAEKRRTAGKQGGAPTGNDNANSSKNNQKQANSSKNNQKQANSSKNNQKQAPLPLPLPLPLPDNKRESKEREKSADAPALSPSNSKPKKIKYAEFVSMTNEEHSSLVAKYGDDVTAKCIEKLDNYKGQNGKSYKSDYRAILNWVVEEVTAGVICQKNKTAAKTAPDCGIDHGLGPSITADMLGVAPGSYARLHKNNGEGGG